MSRAPHLNIMGTYAVSSMENLKMRRLLAFAGIAIISAGIIVMAYGIFTNNFIAQMIGLAGVVIAYGLSVQVRHLRKAYEDKGQK